MAFEATDQTLPAAGPVMLTEGHHLVAAARAPPRVALRAGETGSTPKRGPAPPTIASSSPSPDAPGGQQLSVRPAAGPPPHRPPAAGGGGHNAQQRPSLSQRPTSVAGSWPAKVMATGRGKHLQMPPVARPMNPPQPATAPRAGGQGTRANPLRVLGCRAGGWRQPSRPRPGPPARLARTRPPHPSRRHLTTPPPLTSTSKGVPMATTRRVTHDRATPRQQLPAAAGGAQAQGALAGHARTPPIRLCGERSQ